MEALIWVFRIVMFVAFELVAIAAAALGLVGLATAWPLGIILLGFALLVCLGGFSFLGSGLR